jgi:DNA-binding LacI/PurR family transcriptional regulator
VQHVALETLAERAAAAGYGIEFEWQRKLFERYSQAALRRFVAKPDTAGWVLFYTSEPMQRWFAASGQPCVVSGPACPGVDLSCVYPDTRAFARHAGDRFCAHGHRKLVYAMGEHTSLGDQRAAEAFLEEAKRLGARARIVNLSADTASARRAIIELLAERPRPNGWCSAHTGLAVTILCALLRAGMRIPADAAIVVGWSDVIDDFQNRALAKP